MQGGTRPTLPKGLPPGLEALARQAWHADPALRPSFAAIVDTLTPLASEVRSSCALSRPPHTHTRPCKRDVWMGVCVCRWRVGAGASVRCTVVNQERLDVLLIDVLQRFNFRYMNTMRTSAGVPIVFCSCILFSRTEMATLVFQMHHNW